MRQIGLTYIVHSEIELTREELDLLIYYAESHPDFKCKSAARVGGFLYGFKNFLNMGEKREKDNFIFSISQLDEICKILEVAAFIGKPEPLVYLFAKALSEANEKQRKMNQGYLPACCQIFLTKPDPVIIEID